MTLIPYMYTVYTNERNSFVLVVVGDGQVFKKRSGFERWIPVVAEYRLSPLLPKDVQVLIPRNHG